MNWFAGAVRIIGNDYSDAIGRVEIFRSGVWGTVCDDLWDDIDAGVVCRSLGYSEGYAFTAGDHYGCVDGIIWLDNVECTGTEQSLSECQHNGWEIHNCGHYEDAGVSCDIG